MNLFSELSEQEIQSKLQVSESILGSSGKWSLPKEESSLGKKRFALNAWESKIELIINILIIYI